MATPKKPVKNIGSAGQRVIDEDLTVPEPDGEEIYNDLREQMRRDLQAEAPIDPLTCKVPLRERMTMQFLPVIDYALYQRWIKGCTDKKDVIDYLKMALIVLSNTSVGVIYQGRPQYDRDGREMTLTSDELHEMLGVRNTREAIRKLYRNDGHIIQTMNQILGEAGYSLTGDVEVEDPLDL